ncbi:MAG: YncE family protein [Nitrospirota bacterium]
MTMTIRQACSVFFCAFLLAACRMPEGPGHQAILPEDRGIVYLYLQPLPQESSRLTFELEMVAAVAEDGAEIPLARSVSRFEPEKGKQQRLIASGILPPGHYRGISYKAKKAELKTDEGSAALFTDIQPVVAEHSFTIAKGKAVTVLSDLNYRRAVTSGFNFSPVFTLYQAGRYAPGLIGYISNSGDNTITVFDKRAGKVLSVLATGRQPRGIAFDEQRSRAYVALSGDDAVAVIDLTTNEPLHTIRLLPGSAPRDLALTVDGRTLVSANPGSNSVSIIDPLSYMELGTVAVGDTPLAVLLNPAASRRAYVFNKESDSITAIDIVARSAAMTTKTGTGPLRGQIDTTYNRMYVIYGGTPYLTIIDPATLAVTDQVFIREPAGALKVDIVTDMIYLGGPARGEVVVYDPLSVLMTETIPAPEGVSYLTIDGQENSLLILSAEARTLTSVNINTKAVSYVIDAGNGAYQVAVMGER